MPKSFEQLEDLAGAAMKNLKETIGAGAVVIVSVADASGVTMQWATKWDGDGLRVAGLLGLTQRAMTDPLFKSTKEK